MRRIFQANFVASLVVNFVEAGIDKAHDKVYDKAGLRVEDLALQPFGTGYTFLRVSGVARGSCLVALSAEAQGRSHAPRWVAGESPPYSLFGRDTRFCEYTSPPCGEYPISNAQFRMSK